MSTQNLKGRFAVSVSGFRLGYEEFALQPQRSLQLLSWLAIDFQETMLAPGLNSSSHIRGEPGALRCGSQSNDCRDGAWLGAPAPTLRISACCLALPG